jgi:hypothetical protein
MGGLTSKSCKIAWHRCAVKEAIERRSWSDDTAKRGAEAVSSVRPEAYATRMRAEVMAFVFSGSYNAAAANRSAI